MKKKINIIGAFDRYNYGDILFPLIIEKYINIYKNELLELYELEYFALVKSDLTSIGGKKTLPISDLYNQKMMKNITLVSGGDVLAARIGEMDIDLSEKYSRMIMKKIIKKIIGMEKFEQKCKKNFNLMTKFPWIISEKEIGMQSKVFYNSVGGSTLSSLDEKEQKYILNKLSENSYISVRDLKSSGNLKSIKHMIAPDSATIMSEFFDMNFLEKNISRDVKEFVESQDKYIIIQVNNMSVKNGNDKIISKQLSKIYREYKMHVVLLPIGFAANHDDNIALRKIGKKLNIPYTHIEMLNVYDIMYLIANSNFFAGTSLHGNITAMSYAIPHIGLNKNIKKLDHYLKTWDLEEQAKCIEFSDIYEEFKKVFLLDEKKLINNRNRLVKEVKLNFEKMFSLVEIEND